MPATYIIKTLEVNRHFLGIAKDVLKTNTDKETVNKALEIISEEHDIIKAHIEVGGTGKIENIFNQRSQ